MSKNNVIPLHSLDETTILVNKLVAVAEERERAACSLLCTQIALEIQKVDPESSAIAILCSDKIKERNA